VPKGATYDKVWSELMKKLSGKVALVTGASRGLGKAIAIAFAAEGAKVAVNFHSSEAGAADTVAQIRAAGGIAEAYQADVTEASRVDRLVDAVGNNFGGIDILVNNAGIVQAAPLVQMTPDVWDRVFAVHVRAVYLCSRAVLPHMLKQQYGKIINMSGSFAVSGAENFVHLSAAKGAITGFTRALAREVGPQGVYVNALAPSMIKGETTEKMDPKFLEALRQRYPLRKLGELNDVTASALFLASSDSDFYTGQTLCPSGGEVMV
jgi:3-oxoacyl-[acyl-carrier protein] reductase